MSESQVSDWILRGLVFIAKERESLMEVPGVLGRFHFRLGSSIMCSYEPVKQSSVFPRYLRLQNDKTVRISLNALILKVGWEVVMFA